MGDVAMLHPSSSADLKRKCGLELHLDPDLVVVASLEKAVDSIEWKREGGPHTDLAKRNNNVMVNHSHLSICAASQIWAFQSR